MEGVRGTEERTKFEAGGMGLGPAFRGEFHAVVGGMLVDFAVFCFCQA